MRSQPRAALLHAELVRVEREVARSGDARVFHPEAARRRVARVREEPLTSLALSFVELLECRKGHEHLAAHFDPRRQARARELVRDAVDREDVRGDVFTSLAVAPRGGTRETAVLVQQRHGEAVELGLADEAHGIGDHPLDACVPGEELVAAERVVEREHAHVVTDRRERGRQHPAHLFEWGTLSQLRVVGLQRLELALELVVFAVGDLGLVAVVAIAVISNEVGQRRGAVGSARQERRFPRSRP